MKKLSYIGQIKEGKLVIPSRRRAQIIADIAAIKEDKYVELSLKVLPRRSSNQLNYYWACIIPEVRDGLKALGHDVDDDSVHEVLKLKFNRKTVCDDNGEVIGEYGGSTGELSTAEMAEYIEKIILFAAEYLKVTITPPNSQSEMF